MTVICISIPSYFAYKKYERKRKAERVKVVQRLLDDEIKAESATLNSPTPISRRMTSKELNQLKAQAAERSKKYKDLISELRELSQ